MFHRQLGQFALGRLEFVAITAASTTASLRLRRLQDRNFVSRDPGDLLVRLGNLLNDASSQQRAANDENQPKDNDFFDFVHRRSHRPLELPNGNSGRRLIWFAIVEINDATGKVIECAVPRVQAARRPSD